MSHVKKNKIKLTEAKDIQDMGFKLQKKFPFVIGWSNKIRNGKVRIYVKEIPTTAQPIETVKIEGKDYQIEYFVVGEVRAL